jgi:hypothetical protein
MEFLNVVDSLEHSGNGWVSNWNRGRCEIYCSGPFLWCA